MTEQKQTPKVVKRKFPTGTTLHPRTYAPQAWYGTIVDLKTTLEDVLDPGFFAHHASKFRIGGAENFGFPEVTLVWQDGSRYLRLLVIGADKNSALVKVLEDKDLRGSATDVEDASDVRAEEGEEFFVKYVAKGNKKHCVFRADDKAVMAEGFDTRELALAEMEKIKASMAKAA